MGYRLAMSAEIHDWLTDLRGTDPPAALLAGQALTALATEGDGLGPPLVTGLADWPAPAELPGALDSCYLARLESMQVMRHRVAEAATLRKDIEQQFVNLQATLAEQRQRGAGEPATEDQVAELRRSFTEAKKAEKQLTAASQYQQMRTEAFRTRKEVLTAMYTAAHAEYLIEQALEQDTGDSSPVTAAEARLRDVTSEMARELRQQLPAADLMELRPGAPGDSGIRVLFAVEPAGTALLIAALEGPDAIRDHYREAVFGSAGVLRTVRQGQDDEAAAQAFDDAQSFLDEFFPGDAGDVSAGAAALVAANRQNFTGTSQG